MAVDGQTDDLATVKDYLHVDGIEWIEVENNRDIGETTTWLPLWESIRGEPGVTFRAHAKGVTETDKEQITKYGRNGHSVSSSYWRQVPTPKHRMEAMRTWTDMLYRTNLDHWELIERMLERKPMVGSFRHIFRRTFQGITGPALKFLKTIQPSWYFMGSFYWVRNLDFFSRNWRTIPQTYSGVEVWPGLNGSIRDAFPDSSEYIGTDMRAGVGVDQVVNNRDLVSTFGPSSFDTVVCCECLEHDLRFWDTIEQIHTLLRPQGHLMITTPDLGFPYHAFPFDYWRFTEDVYKQVFFKDMEILDLTHLPGPTIAGLAKKRGD